MATLIRVPDQFTPGAGAVATAATPTCCCCCCVTSTVATSAWLAEGLNADLRQAERQSPAAVILVTLGPLIAVAPLLLVFLLDSYSGLGRLISDHLVGIELLALLVAGLWTLAIPIASGARRPFVGLLRLTVGAVLWIAEFFLAVVTLMATEIGSVMLIPVIIIGLRQFYRRADRR
jgi:hypothetical protein